MKALINYEIAEAFSKISNIQAIPLKPYSRLDAPVASHADMLFCVLDDVVFCYEDYVKENRLVETIEKEGYKVIFISNKCEKQYPYDISLNVLVMGKTLYCNEKYTAMEILNYAKSRGYTIIDVKQGYSACSTLVVDENTAITSDFGIAKAVKSSHKKAIIVNCDDVVLTGYDHGFIGGSTAKINDKIYVFGEISKMNFKNELETISKDQKCEIIPILAGRVYDFGGVKLL